MNQIPAYLKKLANNSWLRNGLALLLLALMLGTLVWYHQELGEALSQANWGWLSLGLLTNLIASLVYVSTWDSGARQLRARGGWRGALVALSVAGAARYVPGGIWPIAGLVYYGPEVGLPRKQMPWLAALAQLIHLLAAGLVAVVCLLVMLLIGLAGHSELFSSVGAAGLAFTMGLAFLFLLPRYIQPLLKLSFSLQNPLNLLYPALYSAGFWLLNGLRLWFLALAFAPSGPELLLYLTWTGAVTTILAAFFFFVPLGLGVVEASLAWWLTAIMPWPQVLAVVALNRLVRTLNDLFYFALTLLLLKVKSRRSK